MTRIYTRTGDHGETGLFGGGRVPKDHPRVEAYGTIDELNSTLGAARAVMSAGDDIADIIERVQRDLFSLGAEVASPEGGPHVPRCAPEQTLALEEWIDRFDAALPALHAFILPGGTPAGSLLHVARTVARRAERHVLPLARAGEVNAEILRYLNRLSDLLFVLARTINNRAGAPEIEWHRTGDAPEKGDDRGRAS